MYVAQVTTQNLTAQILIVALFAINLDTMHKLVLMLADAVYATDEIMMQEIVL